jgi:sugar-phosphatase
MFAPVKAVIFDMDGVLIDSEPLWRKAMIIGFNELGVTFTDDDCRKTTGMRFREVVEIWLEHFKIAHTTPPQLEDRVLSILTQLILEEGKAIDGALDIFKFCREKNLKVGLATSSSTRLVNAVLKKLQLENSFDAVVSAEKMTYGKPHPEVFLVCATMLNIKPYECVIIEDSLNGVVAAKAAQARVFAVPDAEHRHMKGFAVADWQCENMRGVLRHFKEMI